MEWYKIYTALDMPSLEQVGAYVNSDLWWELDNYLRECYRTAPTLSYSHCSLQKGWNVKYRCAGRALCTLYPVQGAFIALVVVGAREQDAVELMMQNLSEYTRRLYRQTAHAAGGRWLMLEVRDGEVLEDVKDLIGIRVKPVVPAQALRVV